jgi:hypothetical protein
VGELGLHVVDEAFVDAEELVVDAEELVWVGLTVAV